MGWNWDVGRLLVVDGCVCFSVKKDVRKGNDESYEVKDEKAMWIAMWKIIKNGAMNVYVMYG